jgi:hypothetical protein
LLLAVLKTKIPRHFKLREFHESSTEYPFLPQHISFLSILVFKNKTNPSSGQGELLLESRRVGRNNSTSAFPSPAEPSLSRVRTPSAVPG